eukprot:35928_1
MDAVNRKINNISGGNKGKGKGKHNKKHNKDSKHQPNPSSTSGLSNNTNHLRKGSVKDMASAFERRARSQGRRQRNKTKDPHRNALKLPNTKSHRRRVSSQFNIQAINAAILQSNSIKTGQDNDNTPQHFPNTLAVHGHGHRHYDDAASDISDGSKANTLIESSVGYGGNRARTASHGSRRNSRVSTQNTGDPLLKLVNILQSEPQERTEEEIHILVGFFENYQIMPEEFDIWSGKAAFRSFIQHTRYRYVPKGKDIFREGDDADAFYFILRGNISVLNNRKLKREIHVVEDHHVFGEIALFNQDKRSATCVATTHTHLAYWDRIIYNKFIRPIKEIKSKAQKIIRDKQGNMLSEDQLIEKAAMFLDDAMHGRELKMHRNGPWPRRIHLIIV